MRRRLGRIAVATAAAAALPIGLAATSAVAATSAPVQVSTHVRPDCVVDPSTGRCVPTVQGSPFDGLGDNIRPDPNTSQKPVGFLPFGSSATVFCWEKGQVESGPGATNDPFWDFVRFNNETGFIADAVLNTHGDITTQVGSCS